MVFPEQGAPYLGSPSSVYPFNTHANAHIHTIGASTSDLTYKE